MLLDLSPMRDARIDTLRRRAWVEPGLAGDALLRQLAPHALFFPTGHCTSVGIGGFLLQGGFGWNSRLWGPACASVRRLQVVCADGELVEADAVQNPDLFWAARGAGPGFFGVVTRFELDLFPRPQAAMLSTHLYEIDELERLVPWLLEIQPEIPRNVECMLFLRRGLGAPGAPRALLMAPALANSEAEAREALGFMTRCPARGCAIERHEFVATSVEEMLRESQTIYPDGAGFWVDNMWTDAPAVTLTPALAEIAATLPPAPSHVMVLLWGPPQPVPDMAFSMQANIYVGLYGVAHAASVDSDCLRWSAGHMATFEHLASGIQLADENLGRRPAPFATPAHMLRIQELRRRWDPDGIFHSYMGMPDIPPLPEQW